MAQISLKTCRILCIFLFLFTVSYCFKAEKPPYSVNNPLAAALLLFKDEVRMYSVGGTVVATTTATNLTIIDSISTASITIGVALGSTPFTLEKLPNGARYDVASISPGCSTTVNGKGTINYADVTNISITCN